MSGSNDECPLQVPNDQKEASVPQCHSFSDYQCKNDEYTHLDKKNVKTDNI